MNSIFSEFSIIFVNCLIISSSSSEEKGRCRFGGGGGRFRVGDGADRRRKRENTKKSEVASCCGVAGCKQSKKFSKKVVDGAWGLMYLGQRLNEPRRTKAEGMASEVLSEKSDFGC